MFKPDFYFFVFLEGRTSRPSFPSCFPEKKRFHFSNSGSESSNKEKPKNILIISLMSWISSIMSLLLSLCACVPAFTLLWALLHCCTITSGHSRIVEVQICTRAFGLPRTHTGEICNLKSKCSYFRWCHDRHGLHVYYDMGEWVSPVTSQWPSL